MRLTTSITLSILVLMQVLGSTANKAGAPAGACGHMTPRHGSNKPQTSASPYKIAVTGGNTYTAGTTVELTISDSRGTGFKGLLIQARSVNGTDQLGTWQNFPKGLQTIKCKNDYDAITHDSNDVKKSAVIQWLPQYNYGDVQFKLTAVQEFTTFWLTTSDTITGNGPTPPSVTEATPGSSADWNKYNIFVFVVALVYRLLD